MADPRLKVADIARAHGFHELGRFAASYRRTFGELSSQTLREVGGTTRRGRTLNSFDAVTGSGNAVLGRTGAP
jgi:hypothetical protein